jgi:hypothetical protein
MIGLEQALTVVFWIAWLAMRRSEGIVPGNTDAPTSWILAFAFAVGDVGSAA